MGGVETRWLGWQFLNGLSKQRWQAGCWLHQCVLRNMLAGSKTWFLCPGMTLYSILCPQIASLWTPSLVFDTWWYASLTHLVNVFRTLCFTLNLRKTCFYMFRGFEVALCASLTLSLSLSLFLSRSLSLFLAPLSLAQAPFPCIPAPVYPTLSSSHTRRKRAQTMMARPPWRDEVNGGSTSPAHASSNTLHRSREGLVHLGTLVGSLAHLAQHLHLFARGSQYRAQGPKHNNIYIYIYVMYMYMICICICIYIKIYTDIDIYIF